MCSVFGVAIWWPLLWPNEELKLLVRCGNLLNERVAEETIEYTLRVEAEKLPE